MMFRLIPPNHAIQYSLRPRVHSLQHHLRRSQAYPLATALRSFQTDRSETPSSIPRCPACSSPLPTAFPVCPACLHISSIPKSMSYHEMLGASYNPNPFIVDPFQLKSKFRQVQSVVHPDRWAGKRKDQQAAAAVMSSEINAALHHLTDPLRRVEYILRREGLGTQESDSVGDMEFLAEVLEIREELENSESQEAVLSLRADNDAKLQETIQEIERLVGQKDWPAVQTAAVKLKYLQGIEDAAAAWPEKVHDH